MDLYKKSITAMVFVAISITGGCSMSMSIPASPGQFDTSGQYAQLKKKMLPVIQKGMKKHKVTGMSIALVDDGEIVWAQGFGYADKENKKQADANTLYKAGSISKVFTATAIMQLVEQGKVDLDAPIQTYIPELNPKYHFKVTKPITLRQIMRHRSGLTGDKMAGMFTESPKRFDSIIEYLNTIHHPYAPDTVSAYSNVATDLQGIVIERVTGMRFEDYIEQHILQPLNMETSTFDDSKVNEDLYSKAYYKHKPGIEYALRDIPAGNLYTSVVELSQFTNMVLQKGKGIISSKSLAMMLSPQANTNEPHDMGMEFGLNWAIKRPQLEYLGPVAWHTGGTLHFMSSMVILPEQGLSVVVLSNTAMSIGFVEKMADQILIEAARIKNGIEKPEPKPYPGKPASTPEVLLNTLPGYYATLIGGMKVKAKGNKLVGTIPGMSMHFHYLDNGWFQLKPRLFGFIPLPNKEEEIIRVTFSDAQGKQQIIANYQDNILPAGVRVEPYEIPEKWKSYLGKYHIMLPEGDHEWFKSVTLSERDGYLFIEYRIKLQGGGRLILRPISDNMAIVEGSGRGMNETIYIEERDGKVIVKYAGFEFHKK